MSSGSIENILEEKSGYKYTAFDLFGLHAIHNNHLAHFWQGLGLIHISGDVSQSKTEHPIYCQF